MAMWPDSSEKKEISAARVEPSLISPTTIDDSFAKCSTN